MEWDKWDKWGDHGISWDLQYRDETSSPNSSMTTAMFMLVKFADPLITHTQACTVDSHNYIEQFPKNRASILISFSALGFLFP